MKRALQTVAVVVVLAGGFAAATGIVGSTAESATVSCTDLLQQSYVKFQGSSLYKKWKQQNPNESATVEAFWSSGGTAPTVATLFGQALVLEKQAQIECSSAPPTTTTEPPVTTTAPPPPSGSIAPGQSWQAAYDAAASGAVLTVQTGNHGSPALVGSKAVTFLGQTGAVVAKMPGDASNVTFDNIDIDTGSTHGQYSASEPRGTAITWRRVDVRGNWASIHTWDTATGFRWLGGSLIAPGERNCADADGQPLWLGADNATVDGVTFGVFDSGSCGSQGSFHQEAIRVQGASDVRVLNVTFSQGSDTGSGHIFITTVSPTARQPKRFRAENTVFPTLVGSYAIQIHANVSPLDSFTFKNNTFAQGVLDPSPFVNLTACGNTGAVPASWKVAC